MFARHTNDNIKIVAIAVALAAFCWHKAYGADANALYRQQVMDEGLQWVMAHTEYKDVPPVMGWVDLTAEQMKAQATRIGGDPRTTVAIYTCSNSQTMYFRADTDLRYLSNQSYLIHELVHHAQCVNHRFSTDKCPVEQEAYAVQAAFMRAFEPQARSHDEAVSIERFAQSIEATALRACDQLRNR